jgi:hypothetical protein
VLAGMSDQANLLGHAREALMLSPHPGGYFFYSSSCGFGSLSGWVTYSAWPRSTSQLAEAGSCWTMVSGQLPPRSPFSALRAGRWVGPGSRDRRGVGLNATMIPDGDPPRTGEHR